MNSNLSTNCKICEKNTSFLGGVFKFHYCEHCGFLFKDDSMILNSNDEKKRYDFHKYDERDEYQNRQFITLINDTIKPYIKGNKILYPVGEQLRYFCCIFSKPINAIIIKPTAFLL